MGDGYTRNDTSNNIADGNVINAADLDGEFDAIEAAFVETTGHTHDGTADEGGPIEVVGPVQDLVITATEVRPKTTNTLDIGTTLLQFKDLYIDGTGYIDAVDIDGGNIDGTIIGASSAAAGSFTTLTASGNSIELSGASPRFDWYETDASADNGKWRGIATSEAWALQALNDAESVSSNAVLINRTGTTIDSIAFTATASSFSGTLSAGATTLTTTAAATLKLIRSGSAGQISSMELYDGGGTDYGRISSSAGNLAFATYGSGSLTTALTLDSSQNATFAGVIETNSGGDVAALDVATAGRASLYLSENEADYSGSGGFEIAHNGTANTLEIVSLTGTSDTCLSIDRTTRNFDFQAGNLTTTGELDLSGGSSTERILRGGAGLLDAESRGSVRIYTDSNNNDSSDADAFVVFTGGASGVATSRLFEIEKDGDATFAGSIDVSSSSASSITRSSAGTALNIISTAATATSYGPILGLYRNNGAGVATHNAGAIQFRNNDSTSAETSYAQIDALISDPTDGAEDGSLVFRTSNSGTMTAAITINSSQLVGIGTSSPATICHIYSATSNPALRVETGATNGQAQINFKNDARRYNIGINSSDNLVFEDDTGGTTPMTITSSGNVGIGTTSPNAPLNVSYSNSARNDTLLLTNTNTSGYGPWINFYGNYNGGYSFAKIGTENDGTGSSLRFHTSNTSGTSVERMRINNSGNVGIGTPAPVGLLDLDGGSSAFTIQLKETSGAYQRMGFQKSNDLLQMGEFNNDGSTFTPILNVSGNGDNVGIGDTSPASPLSIHNSSTPRIEVGYSDTQNHYLSWDSSKLHLQADPQNLNASSAMLFSVDGSERLRIDSSGVVSIDGSLILQDLNASGTDTPEILFDANEASGRTSFYSGNPFCFIGATATTGGSSPFNEAGNLIIQSRSDVDRDIVFVTGATPAEIARVTQDGITFNGDTAAANALDDYEEGTWTPSLEFGGATTGITYTTRLGKYTKVGDKVTVWCRFVLSSKGSATGSATVAGLPFTSSSNFAVYGGGGPIASSGAMTLTGAGIAAATASSSSVSLRQSTSSGDSVLTEANLSNTSTVHFSVTYFV